MTDEATADMTEVPMGGDQPKAPEQPTATGDKTATETTTVGGVTLDGTQFPLAITLISSIILLIATTATPEISGQRDSYENYAISISCVSLIISFLSLVMHRYMEESYDKIKKPVGFINFVWSLVGACFLTFKSPFVTTSNGYFAAWATVYGCATSMGTNTCSSLESNIKSLGAIAGHLASSIVTLIACIPEIESRSGFSQVRSNAIYTLSLSCFSIVVMSTLMMMDRKGKTIGDKVNLGLMSFLALGWLIAACLVTFDGPFLITGNGYFASWTAFLTAGAAAFGAYETHLV